MIVSYANNIFLRESIISQQGLKQRQDKHSKSACHNSGHSQPVRSTHPQPETYIHLYLGSDSLPRYLGVCASSENSNAMPICYFKLEFLSKDSTLKNHFFLCVWLRRISQMTMRAWAQPTMFAWK